MQNFLVGLRGLAEACRQQPELVGAINVAQGKIRHKAVAEAHGLPWEPVSF